MTEYGFVDVPSDDDSPRYTVGAEADAASRMTSVKSWLMEDAEVVMDHSTGTGYINPEIDDEDPVIEQAKGYARQERYGDPTSFVVEKTEDDWWEDLLEDVWAAEHGEPARPDTGFDHSEDDLRFSR